MAPENASDWENLTSSISDNIHRVRLSRRRMLGVLGLPGAAILAGGLSTLLAACGNSDNGTSSSGTTTSGGGSSSGTASSSGASTAAAGPPKKGGTLQAAMQVDVTQLDPHFSDSYSSTLVTEEVYEGLVQFDPNMTIKPNLATSWDVAPDGLTYTFKMKPNVQFHNGRTMVVDDIVYSINRIADPKGGSTIQYLLASVASTTAPDPNTVQIKLSKAFAPLLTEMPQMVIVPPEVVKAHGDLKTVAIGTGPFKFVEFIPNEHTKLVRNENYHEAGLPYLDGITWVPIPDDTTRTANIQTGSIDFADQIPQKDIDNLKKQKGVVLSTGPSTLNDYLILNTTRKPFTDVRVRQAIAWAIDRQSMTDTILFGHGKPIDGGIIPEWSWAYSNLHVYTKPDIAKAKQLMSDAGYANGFNLTIGAGASYAAQVQAAEVLKDQLSQIGINVTPNPQEWATYLAQTINPKNFDAAIIGWIGAIDPDDVLYPRFSPKGSFDESGYNNPQVTQLLDQGRELQTQEKRKPIYNQAEKIIVDESAEIFFYFYDQYEALRDYVEGYQHMANASKVTFKRTWLNK